MNVTRTWSPAVTRIIGPGTVPLIVHASWRWPLTGTHMTCLAVRIKCLAPSGSIVYFANWFPKSCMAFGTFDGVAFVFALEVLPMLVELALLEAAFELLDWLGVVEAPKPKNTSATITKTATNRTARGEVIPRHHETVVTGCPEGGRL